MTQKHRAAIIYCLIFTFLLYTRKATKYFPFVKECKSQLLHVFQNSRTNLSNIIFLYPFFKMKITQQPCSRGTLEHIQNEMKFFFGYEISFKILLFENIWPVTIYSGPGQKHTGVLLPFSIVLFL